jgi:hypothetical protein
VLPALDSELLLSEPEDDIPTLLRDDYLRPLHRMLGLPMPEANLRLFPSSHAGTALALEAWATRPRCCPRRAPAR